MCYVKYVCMYVCMYAYILCMYVCSMYVCMYVHMYVLCMYGIRLQLETNQSDFHVSTFLSLQYKNFKYI